MIILAVLWIAFLIVFALYDDSREERIEEALKYEPDPAHPVTRFCTAEEMRKRDW
jgi:hypothetical protein